MSHTINSHVLTGRNPCINKAIHVLLKHGFVVLHISISVPSQKLTSSSVTCTTANVIPWPSPSHQNEVTICLGSSVFKMSAGIGNVPSRAITATGKKNFSMQFLLCFQVTKCFYAIRAIQHDFLIHLDLLGFSGGVETLTFQAWVSTPPSGPSRC